MTDREPVNIMGVFAFPDPDKDKRVIRFIDSDYHNSYRNFGPYNTKAELYAALEQYTNDQTKSGNMTEVEANSILDKYR